MSIDRPPLLAAIRYEHGFHINATFRQVVARLRQEAIVVGGVLQEAEVTHPDRCAVLNVIDVRSTQRARITEDRGKESLGCKLDARGLAGIAHCIHAAIGDGVDLIVINRFGRAESEGGGLLSSISEAVCAGIPVLTAVRDPYVTPWRQFHGGLATDLSPSVEEIIEWCKASCRRSARVGAAS